VFAEGDIWLGGRGGSVKSKLREEAFKSQHKAAILMAPNKKGKI
jgi:hypothetical protein